MVRVYFFRQFLMLISIQTGTDTIPFYAPDGTLNGLAYRRLEVADMVDLFIPAPE